MEKELSRQYFPIFYLKIFGKYPEYFGKTAYYGVDIKNDESELIEFSNVLIDDIPTEIICLKLIHNLSMIYCHKERVFAEGAGQRKECTNNYFEIEVSPDRTNISETRGYGFFGIKNNQALTSLEKLESAIKDKLKDLSKQKKYAMFKNIVDNYVKYCYSHPNDALFRFVKDNFELYKKYDLK